MYGDTYIKVGEIRGDYVLKSYQVDYFGNPIKSLPPYATVTAKIYASGEINVTNSTGDFTIHYAGDGSWYKRDDLSDNIMSL